MPDTISTRLEPGGILVATLNRPERRNAFTVEMCRELIDLFHQVDSDDEVRAVIVTGAGEYFCVGMDLGVAGNVFGLDETQSLSLAELRNRMDDPTIVDGVRDTGGQVVLAIDKCLKPVIAAINGTAVGIGATMTLAMDYRLATPDALLGFVFGQIGITPEACSSVLLPQLVGIQQALDWVYRATPFPASEGLEKGLLQSVHAKEALIDAALDLARALTAGRSALAIGLTRQLYRQNSKRNDVMLAHQTESLAVHWLSTRDGKEGVGAFQQKRDPQFSARLHDDLPPDIDDWWL